MTKEELIIYAITTSEVIKEEKKQELIDYVSNFEKESQKYKEVFNKVKKIIMQPNIEIREYHSCDMDYVYVNEQLLDILKEVSK